jgi:hypothetical protein
MIFQKSLPVETGFECLSYASTAPLKIWMHHPPHLGDVFVQFIAE